MKELIQLNQIITFLSINSHIRVQYPQSVSGPPDFPREKLKCPNVDCVYCMFECIQLVLRVNLIEVALIVEFDRIWTDSDGF